MNQNTFDLIDRKYQCINTDQRISLLVDILVEGLSIKEAATKNNIKFSTAKVILKLFKQEGRIGKLKEIQLTQVEICQQRRHKSLLLDDNAQLCQNLLKQIEDCKTRNNQLQQTLTIYKQVNNQFKQE
ncbi:unnamed protein product (macronuclear) [Paramecium tetraurelia]|uniref:HTH psq-type domain-containing protein n=1 Tax=Paramecium tetraurelia TaxID=5888 RepID=A0DGI3_PARTE|nr:uncharacterized protein GSPATT00002279001 [Paramecium tetraurelia]CAK82150.1 unnamed protein product [Paramecium tetraurelia]|eukprot:XP_001449547.1 hypothetical protein (macronuclear) [Paramecium tetraurelia strain d4-2]